MRGETSRSVRSFVPKPHSGGGIRKSPSTVRPCFYFVAMPKRPSRLDLLELDIDLRLTDLWREAIDVNEWNLEVVAAFLRAAYGKGYCDALTEDAPGSLCHEHGYRIPERERAAERAAEPDKRAA
jgi:hypothetical protein